MSRDAGQITTRQALAGAVVLVVALAGIITGLEQLVSPGDRLPALEAPAADEPPCPEPTATRRQPVPVSADRLIECPESYDGERVTYRGEAVRAVLLRGDRAWLHLNDDPYALELGPLPSHRTTVGGNSGIPVSVARAVADQITHVGDYRTRGDILTVTGVFHRADPNDAGAPAIQADTARIDRTGTAIPVAPDTRRLAIGVLLAVLATASVLAARRSRTAM